VKKILTTLLIFLVLSCSRSKVAIKPEQDQTKISQRDTSSSLSEPRKLFSDQIPEATLDSVIIPKRTKSDKSPQIIVAPIILPITTPFQIPETKPEPKPEKTPEPQPPQPQEVKPEKEIKPEIKIETTEPVKAEPKPAEPRKTSEYFIQIGAFVTENSAVEQLKNFKKLYPSKNAHIFFDSTLGFYKVQINGVRDSTELEQILSLIHDNFPDAFITSNVPKSEQTPQPVELHQEKATPPIKLQIGAYSKISQATQVKEYVESKFNVKSDIVQSGSLFKVLIFLNEKSEEILNQIKSEFPDAFITK